MIEKMEPRNKKTVFFILLLALLASAGLIILGLRKKSAKAPAPKPAGITLAKAKAALLSLAKINIPKAKETTDVKADTLPPDLKFLILDSAKGIKVQNVAYQDGTKGYAIDFFVEQSLRATNLQYEAVFRNLSAWSITTWQRANLFALIEVRNDKYVAQITQDYLSDSENQVKIKIVKKGL